MGQTEVQGTLPLATPIGEAEKLKAREAFGASSATLQWLRDDLFARGFSSGEAFALVRDWWLAEVKAMYEDLHS